LREAWEVFLPSKWRLTIGVGLLAISRMVWSELFDYVAVGATRRLTMAGIFDWRFQVLEISMECLAGTISAPTLAGIWFASLHACDGHIVTLDIFFRGFTLEFFPKIFLLYLCELGLAVVSRHTFGLVNSWLDALFVVVVVFFTWFAVPIVITWPDTKLTDALKLSVSRVRAGWLSLLSLHILCLMLCLMGLAVFLIGLIPVLPVVALAQAIAFREFHVLTPSMTDDPRVHTGI